MKGLYYVEGGQGISLPVRVNQSGELIIARQTGDDPDLDVVKASPRFEPLRLTTSGNAQVKTGPGLFGGVVINQFTACGLVTIYDGTATTGDVIASIKLSATQSSEAPYPATYDVEFVDGLLINLDRAMDVTVRFL